MQPNLTLLLTINCTGNCRNGGRWSLSAVVEKHNSNTIPGISTRAVWRLVSKRHDSDFAVYEVKMRLEIFANQVRASSRSRKLLIRCSRTGVTLDDNQMTEQ
jgi:hypothetical protein